MIARDITVRKRGERRLAAEHAVTRALAESANLEDAAPKVLQTVGETLGCDLGVLWEVGLAPEVLRCVAVWHPPGIEVTEFEQHSRRIAFARGEGLPGRAWDSGQPAWVPEAPFPRSVAAQRNGPCGALAFPLRSNGNVLGVIEFFSPELRQPQEAVLAMMASIGTQVGQFIERRRAEMALHARAREFRTRARDSARTAPPGPAHPGRLRDRGRLPSRPGNRRGLLRLHPHVGRAPGYRHRRCQRTRDRGRAAHSGNPRLPARSPSPTRTPAPSSASSTVASRRISAPITSSPFSSPDSVPPRAPWSTATPDTGRATCSTPRER